MDDSNTASLLGEGDIGGRVRKDQALPSCTQLRLKYLYRRSDRNLLLQFIPVRDYSNAERMLAATGFTSLLLNLENITAKPRTGGVAVLHIQDTAE